MSRPSTGGHDCCDRSPHCHRSLRTQTQAQRQLFQTKILPTLVNQKSSALQSYESDKGDLRVVTDLYLQEQSTRIKLARLRVNEQLILSKMNYWLSSDSTKNDIPKDSQNMQSNSRSGYSRENRK